MKLKDIIRNIQRASVQVGDIRKEVEYGTNYLYKILSINRDEGVAAVRILDSTSKAHIGIETDWSLFHIGLEKLIERGS